MEHDVVRATYMASHYGSDGATMNYTKEPTQRLRGLEDYERLKLLGKVRSTAAMAVVAAM